LTVGSCAHGTEPLLTTLLSSLELGHCTTLMLPIRGLPAAALTSNIFLFRRGLLTFWWELYWQLGWLMGCWLAFPLSTQKCCPVLNHLDLRLRWQQAALAAMQGTTKISDRTTSGAQSGRPPLISWALLLPQYVDVSDCHSPRASGLYCSGLFLTGICTPSEWLAWQVVKQMTWSQSQNALLTKAITFQPWELLRAIPAICPTHPQVHDCFEMGTCNPKQVVRKFVQNKWVQPSLIFEVVRLKRLKPQLPGQFTEQSYHSGSWSRNSHCI